MKFWFGYLFGVVITVLNLNSMLYKATYIIRGDLTGSDLELALLKAVALSGAVVVASIFFCMYIRDLHKAHRESIKEKKKCGSKCSTPG